MWGTVVFALLSVSVLPTITTADPINNQNRSPSVLICEDSAAIIACPGNSRIKVISANYGRTQSGEVCRHGYIGNTNCRSSTSDGKIKSICNHENMCWVKASNSWFGDPCAGVVKYLEVKYDCV